MGNSRSDLKLCHTAMRPFMDRPGSTPPAKNGLERKQPNERSLHSERLHLTGTKAKKQQKLIQNSRQRGVAITLSPGRAK